MHQAKLYGPHKPLEWLNEGKFTADTFIQHHKAVQPLTTIPTLAKLLFEHQTAHTDRQCALEKQPAKADHLSVACFEYEIY